MNVRLTLLAAAALGAAAVPVAAQAATTVAGTTNANGTFAYAFSFAGGPLSIAVNSGGVNPIGDPEIYLFQDNGSPLTALTGTFVGGDDDSGPGLDSLLTFNPLAAGNYVARIGRWPFSLTDARSGIDASPCRDCTFTVEFSQTVGQPGGVPEPGTWAMLIAGFAAIGFVARRKSKQQARVRFAF